MNAIILAAGLGSRFGEVTKTTHKSLLPVGGVPNLERTINYLHEFGITDITIVVGYLSESFAYLPQKYKGVTLVHNRYFSEYNNIYTFSLAAGKFGDTYVIDADCVLLKNVFTAHDTSTYYTVVRQNNPDAEWIPVSGADGFVTRMDISNAEKPSMFGISYWTDKDCKRIVEALQGYLSPATLENPKLYWDDIPLTLLDQLKIATYEVDWAYVGEMDTIENYQEMQRKLALLEQKKES